MTDARAGAVPAMVQVLRPDTDRIELVTPMEAARAMVALGRQAFGESTPGFAAVVMRAVELLTEHGLTPAGKRIGGTS